MAFSLWDVRQILRTSASPAWKQYEIETFVKPIIVDTVHVELAWNPVDLFVIISELCVVHFFHLEKSDPRVQTHWDYCRECGM